MVVPSGALSSRTPGGSSSLIFSGRPGVSMPPRTQTMSSGRTPWSSCRMARAQTCAVSWYSGRPTRRPFRSSGRAMRSLRTWIEVCRKARDRNTGTAMYGQSPRECLTR